ncbi:hypothetical protein [Streptomyces sp. ISL-66]|uniref:nSTAND3 domain-containing NTPase n=1 Tax=Streptomyces sp. ISL-66 TaxID=2819186 RepID=UPI0035B28199
MASAPEQVATFVVTNAYRKAARALRDHGFVLLLGDPAVGKSVIALMLAISAADNWGCPAIKARTSEDLVQRWNPHEREQFFWLDDAFGAVRSWRRGTCAVRLVERPARRRAGEGWSRRRRTGGLRDVVEARRVGAFRRSHGLVMPLCRSGCLLRSCPGLNPAKSFRRGGRSQRRPRARSRPGRPGLRAVRWED